MAVAGDRLVVGLSDGRVRGILSRRPSFWLTPPAPATALGVSADGRYLLVTSSRGTNWIYDITGPAPVMHRRWERKVGTTEGLTRDGRMLVRGDVRGQVRGYELEGYKLKWLVKAERLAMSPDGLWAILGLGKALTVHDAATGLPKGGGRSASGQVIAMAVASAVRLAWLEEAGGRCALRLLNWGTRSEGVPCASGASLAFSPQGGLLALSLGVEAQLRDGRSGGLLARHRRDGGRLLAAPVDDRTYAVAGLAEGTVTWLALPTDLPRAAPR